jgi:hypothetical protein
MSKYEQRYMGRQFGRLTVIGYIPGKGSGHHPKLICKCSCGNEAAVFSSNLLRRLTRSCGCLNDEARVLNNTKHGGTRCSEYVVWRAMLQRCTDPGHTAFENYGGRGICICDRWLKFEHFRADMGPRPSLNYSLDRYPDQNGNYEPTNCRWATKSQQARNKRNNRLITFCGFTLTLAEWAPLVGISASSLAARLDKYSYSVADAIITPRYGWGSYINPLLTNQHHPIRPEAGL